MNKIINKLCRLSHSQFQTWLVGSDACTAQNVFAVELIEYVFYTKKYQINCINWALSKRIIENSKN